MKIEGWIMVIVLLSLMVVIICITSDSQNTKINSLYDKIEIMEKDIAKLKPIPRLIIEHATIYTAQGEIVIETPNEVRKEKK